MRILILGASGMLGHQLWRHLCALSKTVYGVIRNKRTAYLHRDLFNSERMIDCIDARDFAKLRTVMNQVNPDVILNCVGITKRRLDIGNPGEAIRLNALLPHDLAAWGKRNTAKIINFSTDCVFDGQAGGYTESSRSSAQDLYGKTKALGEITGENTLTIRSSFIGPELQKGTELFEWFISQQGTVHGFSNAIFSGLTTFELSRVVTKIIFHHPGCTGLYHLSSNPISKYDLLHKILKHMDLPIKLVPDDSFKCDRSLDSSRFRKDYGYEPPSWEEMILELTTNTKKENE